MIPENGSDTRNKLCSQWRRFPLAPDCPNCREVPIDLVGSWSLPCHFGRRSVGQRVATRGVRRRLGIDLALPRNVANVGQRRVRDSRRGWCSEQRRATGTARLARLCEVIFSPVIFARSLSPARMRAHAPACVRSGGITSLTSQKFVSGWRASLFSARLAKIVTSQIARLARLAILVSHGPCFAGS